MAFQGFLKEDTAATLRLGPFVDITTGVDYEAGMAAAMNHGTTGVRISKNGGALAARTTATQPTYDAFGYYLVDLDATDTGTPGRLKVIFGDAAVCLPCEADFEIVAANVFDSLFSTAAADLLDVNMGQYLGTAAHAASEAGTACVEVVRWGGNDVAATAVNGVPKVAVTHVNAAAQTATLDTIKAETVSILADTGELQTNQGNWLTAAGFATPTNITAGTITNCTTATNLTNAPTAGDLTAAMKTSVTAAMVAAGGSSGSAWTYTLTDSGTGAAIAGAMIWITSDLAGTTIVRSALTNASGVAAFTIGAGTWYIWRSKAGYNFTNPDLEVIT